MGWIKRNLFFVIGGGIALVLLGGAGFYIYQGWSNNSAASDKLNEIYSSLKQLADQKPGPGANNTEIAKDQEKQILDWINSAGNYFQPIPAIPSGEVTSETFAAALRRTVAQLNKDAQSASVSLPPQYDFSFAAERPLMQFASGSLAPLAVQLGEVTAIAEVFFSARINSLDSIQRARVSDDDANGPQADYTDQISQTNSFAVITPYIVTFRSFSPEIARVISAFANSSNAFIIHSITVEPAGQGASPDASQGGLPPEMGMPGQYPGGYPPRMGGYPGGYPGGNRGGYPGGYPPGGNAPPPPAQLGSRGGLQTVLKEQLLRTTLEVELVKLLPKS
jgi:hypothetical protein